MNPESEPPLNPPASPPGDAVSSQEGLNDPAALAVIRAEIARQLSPQNSWGSALVIFAVTLLVFLGSAGVKWSWEYALILVGILLFHELGHYAAMRLFRYQNLRMFFIPLFGAAVSGQHFNVPGWKKAVVSLMGPLPGIAVGIVLAMVNVLHPQEWLGKVAGLMLILNGFNLLPLLPLDGGWLLNAVVFCRNRWLETLFKVVTALGLLFLAYRLGAWLLAIPGVFMLLTASVTFTVGTLASRLQAAGVSAVPGEDGLPADAVVDRIAGELSRSMPGQLKPQSMAGMVLQVFEKMNARPPGGLAAVGLLLVHGGGLVLALLFAAVTLYPRLWQAEQMPRLVFAGDHAWRGEAVAPGVRPAQLTLGIAHHRTPQQAREAYGQLDLARAGARSVTWFGQSVLAAGVDLNERQQAELKQALQQFKARVFLVSATNAAVFVNLDCTFRDATAAKTMRDGLNEFGRMSGNLGLLPPWTPADFWPADRRESQEAARAAYLKILAAEAAAAGDLKVIEAQQELVRAQRAGETNRLEGLADQVRLVRAATRAAALERLRTAEPGLDSRVLELNARRPVYDNLLENWEQFARRFDAWSAELAELLGRTTHPGGSPGATIGEIRLAGTRLELRAVQFDRLDVGLPALARHLLDQGGTELKYAIPDVENLGPLEEPSPP